MTNFAQLSGFGSIDGTIVLFIASSHPNTQYDYLYKAYHSWYGRTPQLPTVN